MFSLNVFSHSGASSAGSLFSFFSLFMSRLPLAKVGSGNPAMCLATRPCQLGVGTQHRWSGRTRARRRRHIDRPSI
jgi:hypothetical protein